MRRPPFALALVLALPLSVPLACGDDNVGTTGGGGGGGATSTTGGATSSSSSGAGPTVSSSSGSSSDGGGTSAGGGTSNGGAGPGVGGAGGSGVGGNGNGGAGVGGNGNGGAGVGGNGNGGDGVGGDSSVISVGTGPVPTEEVDCQNLTLQCGDLDDNDVDGLIDSQDPDCLGPCDDDEGSLDTDIEGGDGGPCFQDCFFDGNSGDGNDECNWDHRCDELSVDPQFYPEPDLGDTCEFIGLDQTPPSGSATCGEMFVEQNAQCESYCAPLVPNGCDCFGCCELPAGSGEYKWLGSRGLEGDTVCSWAEVDNPEICHPCTPVEGVCFNACDPCEICIGAPLPDPDECNPGGTGGNGAGGGGQQCEDGVQPCGLQGQDPCPTGLYCISGCCQPAPT